jgi:hypothetical protein
MAELTKPVEPVAATAPEISAPTVDPVPALTDPLTETAPAETTGAAATTEETAAATEAVEGEKKEEASKKVDEPITSGVLGYKQPGFPK